MGFPRQEYWSGLLFPSLGHLLDPGIKPGSLALQADFFFFFFLPDSAMREAQKEDKVSEIAQLCLTLCDPIDCSLTRFLHPWDFPGKNTGVGNHFLLQEIFPTQGLNPGLLHCRQTLYCLSHWGSPKVMKPFFN